MNADPPPRKVRPGAAAGAARPGQREELASVYERHFDDVCRWLRALGAPPAELQDCAQEVFLVARRRYEDFDGRNVAAWLYGIGRRVAAHARRRAWVRRWLRGGADVDTFAHPAADPAQLVERADARRQLHRLLGEMSARRRAAFVLSELEGLSAEEIAALEGVSVAAVWSLLHHARRDFVAIVARHRRRGEVRGGR